MSQKPHISPSQLESYTRCGEAYRRRYVLGHKIPPSVALAQGIGVHKAAEDNFRQKLDSHQDLKKSEIVDRAVEFFDGIVKNEGLWLGGEDSGRTQEVVSGEGRDFVSSAAGILASDIAPKYQPADVESTHEIEIPNSSHNLLGRLDIVTDDKKIVDLKTGKKSMSQSDVDSMTQLSFYDVTYYAKHGEPPKSLVIEQIVPGKKETKVNYFETSRDDQSRTALVNRINTMIGGLQAGIFMPATPGAWWCSERFCGYHSTCSYVRQGIKKPN